jgi:hypothetical protein
MSAASKILSMVSLGIIPTKLRKIGQVTDFYSELFRIKKLKGHLHMGNDLSAPPYY